MKSEGLTGIVRATPFEVKLCGKKTYDENFETATKPLKFDLCKNAPTS